MAKRKPKRPGAGRPGGSSPRNPRAGTQNALFAREVGSGDGPIELPGFEVEGYRCPEVLLEGPEVDEYADLLVMRTDLDQVIAMCDTTLGIAQEVDLAAAGRTVAMRGSWEAAVVAYGRTFVKGVSAAPSRRARTPFPAEILGRLTVEQRAVHDRTITLRNKHVGHRVNDWTQVRVTAVLNPEGAGPRGVLSIAGKVVTAVGGPSSASELRAIAAILRDGLSERISALEAQIEEQARAELIDALYEVVSRTLDAAPGSAVLPKAAH